MRHAQAEAVLLGSALYVSGKLCHANITKAEHEYTAISRNLTAEAESWTATAGHNTHYAISTLDSATKAAIIEYETQMAELDANLAAGRGDGSDWREYTTHDAGYNG
jgi:hypothetical protein